MNKTFNKLKKSWMKRTVEGLRRVVEFCNDEYGQSQERPRDEHQPYQDTILDDEHQHEQQQQQEQQNLVHDDMSTVTSS